MCASDVGSVSVCVCCWERCGNITLCLCMCMQMCDDTYLSFAYFIHLHW